MQCIVPNVGDADAAAELVTGPQEPLHGLRRFGVRDLVGSTSRRARQIPKVAPAERGATTSEGRK